MKTLGILILIVFNFFSLSAQNKDTANISIYGYRLHTGTYSWRNTNTYFDRTPSWDTSPYTEGHLRHYNGTYRQNFRLLFPNNYDANYSGGYPLMLVFHGAGERGNCWQKPTSLECYYSDLTYNPNTPPSDATQEQIDNLLNNDHNLSQGAGAHLSARNRAGALQPNDPGMPERAFPGFVLYPQNLNGWGLNDVRDAIRTVRLLIKKYNIDQDKVYVSGLSNGGRAVLMALVEADWLFAAAATQSAIPDHNLYKSQIDSAVNVPIWMFQGGQDDFPAPATTKETIRVIQAAGGMARYTEYPDIAHGTWNTAYAEPDYFSWFFTKNKSNLFVYYGNPNVCGTNNVGAKLSMPQGFAAYEWERDGVLIPGATSYLYVASDPGVYRGRFKRGTQWNNWSAPVNVGVQTPIKPIMSQVGSVVLKDLNGKNTATLQGPEGAAYYYWYKDNVPASLPNTRTVTVKSGDCTTGPCANGGQYTLVTAAFDNCPSQPSNVKGVFFNDQAPLTIPVPTNFTGTLDGATQVVLRWNDISSLETGYEIWRRKSSDNASTGWTFVTITNEDAILYTDKGLASNTTYWYKIRAVSNTARSNYAPGNSKIVDAQNLIITTGADSTPPPAPANLNAVLTDTDIATKTASIRLTWDASVDDTGIKEYQITYGATTVTVPATPTSYTVAGLPLNKDYNFSVYAVDLAGNRSPASSPALQKTYIDGFFWHHSTGGYTDIRDIPEAKWSHPEFKGRSANLTLEPRTQDDYFIFRFYGYIYISNAGQYQFRVQSNDGVQLYLDGVLVARRNGTVGDGQCATTNFTGGIPPATLSQGPHTLEVRYFQYTGDRCLGLQWKGPDAGNNAGKYYDVPDGKIKSYDVYTPPTAPQDPQNLVAVANGMTRINLSWTYPGSDSVQFEIQRALSEAGPFTVVNRVATTTYSDVNLLPGKTYYYRLRSVNTAGVSAFTPVVNATTAIDSAPPSAPLNLTLISKTISSASLAWTASTDNAAVTGYEIWGNGVLLATTPLTYHVLQNLQPFTSYSVYVVAYDANNNKSLPSNTVTFETIEPIVYFSKATGALNDVTTWGTNADGSGDSPSTFDTNGLYLYISNRATTNVGGPWTVGGSTSRIIVSAGITLTAESAISATMNASENSVIILANPSMPAFDALSPSSTVIYNQNATMIQKAVYGNLVLNGTGSKTFPTGETKAMGNVSIANGLAVKGSNGNLSSLALTKDILFNGTRGATNSDVTIGLSFVGNVAQNLTASADLDLFEVKTSSETELNLSTANPISLKLGSINGGGITLENGSSFLVGKNTITLLGASAVNRANQSGTLKVDSATIAINSSSTGNSNLYFDSTANKLYYLQINLTGPGKTIVRTPVEITHGIKILSGELNSDGFVTLISTATKSANLEEIENGGKVNGDMIVQRYISAKEKTYRYMSTPVAGTKIADWQKYFAITGNFEGRSTGTGLTTSPSLYIYREPNWVAYPTTNNQAPIEKGVGYSAYIRNATSLLMENVGNPFQGNVQFTVYGNENGGWNLLGNPYASTIEWSTDAQAWQKSQISNVVAVRNNFNTTAGQFMYYDAATGLGTGSLGVLVGGRIAQGQAFYVQSTGSAPALTITESAKSTGQQTFYRDENENIVGHIMLRLKNGDVQDNAIISLTDFAKDEFEAQYDGMKLANVDMFNLSSLSSNAVALAINNLSDAFCTKSIALSLENTQPGSYTLYAEEVSSLSGVGSIVLKDNFNNTSIDLLSKSFYTFDITSEPETFGKNRFEIIINRPDLDLSIETKTSAACDDVGKVNLATSQSGATYSIVNNAGKVLALANGTGGELEFTIPKENLTEGLNDFFIEASFKGCESKRLSSNVSVDFVHAPTVQTHDVSVCKGEKATLEVSSTEPTAQFTWYSNDGTEIKGTSGSSIQTAEVLSETYYFVSAKASKDCSSSKQLITVTPVEIANPELVLTADTLFTQSVSEKYIWTIDNEEIAESTVPFLVVNTPGKYSVTCVTGACTRTSSIFEVTELNFGERATLSLYPNPTTARNIHVRGAVKENGVVKLTIADITGRELFNTTANAESLKNGVHIMPSGGLKNGMYFLILEENAKTRKIKFIIEE